MRGWILYYKRQKDITPNDYGVSRFLAAAQAMGITLEIVCTDQFQLIVSDEDNKVLLDGEPTQLPDFLIPRLGSNTSYFALALIRQLENLGVRVFNTSRAIEGVKDKLYMHQVLAKNGLPTPKSMVLKYPLNIDLVRQEIGFPIIVKNITGTEGQGIYLCPTESEFLDLAELIYSHNRQAQVLLQHFMHSSKGQDLRVFVVGGKVLGTMRRFSDTSFKANFSRGGGQVSPFELTPQIEYLALETARLANLEIAGIDLLFDHKDGFTICEANSSPGFRGLEQVVGNHIAEDILAHVREQIKGS